MHEPVRQRCQSLIEQNVNLTSSFHCGQGVKIRLHLRSGQDKHVRASIEASCRPLALIRFGAYPCPLPLPPPLETRPWRQGPITCANVSTSAQASQRLLFSFLRMQPPQSFSCPSVARRSCCCRMRPSRPEERGTGVCSREEGRGVGKRVHLVISQCCIWP